MKMGNHEVSNAELSRQIDEIFDVVSSFTNPDGTAKEVCDDNGKPFKTTDGTYIPNNEYDLDGVHWETDDNGNIYKANGEYYPNDWFVVNGEFFQTDENGAIIQDSSESAKSEFVRHEPRTTTLSDGTVIELPDPALYSAPESSAATDVYDKEELIDLIAIDCPEGYLELTNAIDRINEDRSPDEPEVTPDYKVLEKDELGNSVLVKATFSDGDTAHQYIFACSSETNENASGKLFKYLYENYKIGLEDIASVTDWDYRPEHAIITTSPNEESVWVLAHTIEPKFPKDFAYACMDWVKQEDGSWEFGYEFPIQQEYDSNFAEDALLWYLSDTLGWELGSNAENDAVANTDDSSLDAYVSDVPDELCDDNGKQYRTEDGGWIPNDTYVLDEVTYKTDDNGNIYSIDGKLQPNTTYELNGNVYTTDDNGRIISCEAKPVRSPENPRDNEAQRQAGGEDRRPNDQGGHIVGRDMNGDGGIGNLVAMDSKINQSDYKRMENDIKAALDEGKDVTTKTEMTYSGDSERPDKIIVTVTVDDKDTVYKFDNNLDGSLRDEVPENGKETVQDRLDETGGEISSIKEEYDEDGNLVETTVYITYKGEDGTNYRTSVVIENQ